MAAGKGTASKIAVVQGSAWGAAVTLEANHRRPFKSTSLKHHTEQVADDSITGTATRPESSAGNRRVDGAIVSVGDYRQNMILLAALMGGDTAALVETGVYTHTMPFLASTDGKFLTVGVDYGGKKVHVFKSVKPSRARLACRAGGYLEQVVDLLGRGLDDSTASTNWTYEYDPSGQGGRTIKHSHLTVRANAASGGALGSGDTVYPASIGIEINRALSMDFAQQGDPEEPIPDAFAEIGVDLEFYGADTALYTLFRDALEDDVALKLDAIWTHPTLLGSTERRKLSAYFPTLKVVDCPTDIPGPGRVPFTVRMTAHKASAVPTGFIAGFDEEVTFVSQYEASAALIS